MRASSRTCSATASMPRSGTLAGVPVERLFTSTMTYSSGDASARLSTRFRPGASLMTSAWPPGKPLVISESAPRRMTIARLGEPALAIAARKPSPIESTATNTITTPAMPITATAEELRRCGIVRTLSAATVRVWESHCIMSGPPEGVGDTQAHRGHGGQRAGDDAERAAQEQPDHDVTAPHDEHRQKRVVEAALVDGEEGDGQ